jgi:hypothetical protein
MVDVPKKPNIEPQDHAFYHMHFFECWTMHEFQLTN